jgi:photosystem II stability/assembly factor-like uncharacterized protein
MKDLRNFGAAAAASLCCLVSGLAAMPVFAGANRWTAIGPDGANVVALAIDPRAPSTVFAGTTGSGVLKTVDSGATWTTANGALPTANISALAIDPTGPSTLFAGTDAGVFKSTDGGGSWIAANDGLAGTPQVTVNALAMDSGSPASLYAATSGGLFKTVDGAASWTSINAGLTGLTPRLLAIDPASPSTVYVGVDDYVDYVAFGVFKSTDAGKTWTRIYTTPLGEDGGYSVAGFAIDPRSSSRLYLALAFGGVAKSVDAGASWSDLKLPQIATWSLAIDSASSELYVGTHPGAILRTVDEGDHWTVMDNPLAGTGLNIIAVAASAPTMLYVGGPTGLARSSDGGATWARSTLGVRNVGVYLMAVDPGAPSTVYTARGGIVTKTTDGGANWIDSRIDGPSRWVGSLLIDPSSPSTLYAAMTSRPPIYKSTDGGTSWAAASYGLDNVFRIETLAIAPSQPSTLYAGGPFALVFKTTNSGASWAWVGAGLTGVGIYVSRLAVDPTNADIVYVATLPTSRPDTDARIFKSTNGGAQWRQVPIALPKGTLITSLVVDPVTPVNVYAAYADYATGLGGVFKSSDSGETWTAPQRLLPAGCCIALAIDPSSPAKIYAATQGGVFRSDDATMSWTPLNAGLPSLSVSSIAVDRTGTLLRAATAAGLFELEYRTTPPSNPFFAIDEIYSNADGSIQFIMLNTVESGRLTGLTLVASDGTTTHAFEFPGDLPGNAINRLFLVGTQGFADLNVVKPDFIVPNGFLFYPNGSVRLGQNEFPYTGLSVDGMHAFWGDPDIDRINFGRARAQNFAGESYVFPLVGPVNADFGGLWWNSPAGSQSGWGISVEHQGDIYFALWATYDGDGNPVWFVMPRGVPYPVTGFDDGGRPNTVEGAIYRTTGPAFGTTPFDASAVTITPVGKGGFHFDVQGDSIFYFDLGGRWTNSGPYTYKSITHQVFANPVPVCAQGQAPGPTPNFQGMWWNPAESGWGLHLTHQGDVIFAIWYTYDAAGKATWLVMTLDNTGPNAYTGTIYRTSGPAFDATSFEPTAVSETAVGTATMTFADRDHGAFSYMADGLIGAKDITRQIFSDPLTVCNQ